MQAKESYDLIGFLRHLGLMKQGAKRKRQPEGPPRPLMSLDQFSELNMMRPAEHRISGIWQDIVIEPSLRSYRLD